MLFNKHSETKQRFGIRKLTIGATSVLLSTLFLTVNNGQKVHAATDGTATNVNTRSNAEDGASSAVLDQSDNSAVAKSAKADQTLDGNNTKKESTEPVTADAAIESTTENEQNDQADDKSSKDISLKNNVEDKSTTLEDSPKANATESKEDDKVPTAGKIKPITKLAAPAPAPSTAGLSDDGLVATDDQGVTLSISKNTLGEGGQLGKSGITVKLSGTVNAGDIYTIKVPNLGWIYQDVTDSQLMTPGALGGFATAKKQQKLLMAIIIMIIK